MGNSVEIREGVTITARETVMVTEFNGIPSDAEIQKRKAKLLKQTGSSLVRVKKLQDPPRIRVSIKWKHGHTTPYALKPTVREGPARIRI